jgi:hypothetical protein
MLRTLPNHTPTDDSMIEDLMTMLRGGAEHAQQRGTLMAFMAFKVGILGFLCPHSLVVTSQLDSTRLSSQYCIIDLETTNICCPVLQFRVETWPDAGIFGPGMVQQRYLAP